MGDESGSAPWLSESRRRLSPAAGGHPSPHVGGRHGFPLDQGSAIDEIGTVPETGREFTTPRCAESCPSRDDGRGEFGACAVPCASRAQRTPLRLFHLVLLIPSWK